MLDLLPDDKRAAVATALQTAFGVSEPDAAIPLAGGFSGARVFRIRLGGIGYLLRVEGAADVLRDPRRWYGCMRIAADAMLAPRLYYADAEAGVAIMDLVEARPLSDHLGPREALIDELAQTVRALHAGAAFPPLVDFLDGVDGIIAGVLASGVVDEAALAPGLAAYRQAAEAYRRLAPELVPSHNDLNPRNLLYDGRRFWLVDWEAAFQADRYFDLAALACVFCPDAQSEARLLQTYFGQAPGPERLARLFLARQVSHAFYAMALLASVAAEAPGAARDLGDLPSLAVLAAGLADGGFVLDSPRSRAVYGLARLEAMREAVASPRFAEAAVTAA